MLNPLRRRLFGKSKRSSSRKDNSLVRQSRRPRVETLEARHLLTGGLTLGAPPAQTLLAGAPLQIPLNAVDTNSGATASFSVSSSNPSISASIPTGNPDLVLNIVHTSSGAAGDSSFSGAMTIELFQNLAPNTVAQIESLVNQGVYTNTSFYRIVQNFVIQAGQGGKPAAQQVNVPTIDDEFNSVLRYSSAGVVGLARQTADDTGSSEFFISQGGPQEFLDYQYAIFGRLVSDPNDLLDKIASLPVTGSSPTNPVTITSASITNDTNDLALQISAPIGTTGTGTITVNVSDGHGGTDSKTFNVTVQADSTDPGPFLKTIPTTPFLQGLATPPTTSVNTPTSFQLPAFDLQGDPITYYDQTALAALSTPITPPQPIDANLNESVNSTTGVVTVTPSNGLVGVTPMFFGVSSSSASSPQNNEPNTQEVPLFINPDAPTSVTLESGSDSGTSSSDGITSRNNSASNTLTFDVTGQMSPGATILLFDGSQQIGSATYTGATTANATVVVNTDGTHVLTDGQHHITAEQILAAQAYTIGNSSGTFTPTSAQSTAASVTIDAAGPSFTSVPVTAAQVGVAYGYTVHATDVVQNGLVYSVFSGPTGMTVDPSTGVVTWTPTAGQVGTQAVDLRATDVAGNMLDQTFNVAVSLAPPVIAVSTAATVAANSTFHTGNVVPITITFTAPVTVTGTPQLALNDGGVATFASGSGTSTLTFNYTVATGQNTSKLDYVSPGSLTLSGGATIKDASSRDAVLVLPATGTDGLAAKNISIVTIVSDVAVTIAPSATTVLPGGSISYTITVTNNGPSDATGVTLTDTLPSTLSFGVQAQRSGPAFTFSHNGNAISDTIATLPASASATLIIVADLNLSTPAGTVVSDTVSVTSTSTDNNLANNTATATVNAIMSGVMLTTDSLDSTKNELVVSGTAGADNISFIPAAGGMVLVNMDGKVSGPFAVSGRIVAYGQSGNNVIMVSPAITLPAFLYAGPGSDTLIGGSGDNVLVGGGGADTLIGGTGHNVLIAGSGPSKLYSTRLGALVGSTSGSILIGGTTDFDHNDTALAAIMHEWGSSDSYATRVTKIKTGSLTAPGVALTSTTVHATKAVDQLYASTGWDWFLAPSLTDQLLGLDPHKKSLLQIN
jgi:large repetitive protein